MFIYEKDGQLRFDFDNDKTTDLTLKLNESGNAELDPSITKVEEEVEDGGDGDSSPEEEVEDDQSEGES